MHGKNLVLKLHPSCLNLGQIQYVIDHLEEMKARCCGYH